MQPRQRTRHISPRPTPKQLRRRRRARPYRRIERPRTGLFGPEELLTAEDERGFGGGHVGDGVEGVGVLPGFEGVAPGVAGGVGTHPAAVAAVLSS